MSYALALGLTYLFFTQHICRAVFVRFSLGGQSYDWRLATIAGMEIAKLVPWYTSRRSLEA